MADSIAQNVGDAKNTFSSWDRCMQKTYCKWPVIAVIIVVSLVAISLLFCLARCICCGAECACCCFRCCAGCCGSGRRGKHERVKSNPYNPPPNQQYQSHTPQMFPQGLPNSRWGASPYVQEAPQFATFETPSKPVNPDALPQHSTWSDAPKHRVEDQTEDVEMKPLNPNGDHIPVAAPVASPAGRSPVHSPVGDGHNPYGGNYQNDPYRPDNSGQNSYQGYGGGQNYYDQSHERQQYSNQYHSGSYQESGVDRGDQHYPSYNHQPPANSYSRAPPSYESEPYARQPSPGYSGTTYARNDYQDGYQSYQSQQQQGGWHTTRRPVNGSFREV